MRSSGMFLYSAALSLVIAGSSLGVTAAHAADKISIMVGGYEKQIYLPAKLAESLGYFKDEGLNIELLNEPAGVDAENEMLAGAVQGVVGFYDHCID
ncbi:ABC transporter substrate-binding protein, partial [Rhizobium sp. BR 318]